MIKLEEHTYGNHIYMKMILDNKRVEEIDVYFTNEGEKYVTSAEHGMELYTGEELERRKELRNQIISAFDFLY